MAYRVSKRTTKMGRVYWRLLWEKYSGDERTQRHVPKEEWGPLGFRDDMSLDDAKAWAKHLNDKDRIVQVEERRQKIAQRLQKEGRIKSAFLPPLLVERFEQEILKRDLGRGEEKVLKYNSTPSHWRLAQKIIADIKIDPSDWYDSRRAVYAAFERRKMSPSYVEKVLRLMNLWGYFYCKRCSKAWEKVPRPRSHDLERIRDRYVELGKDSMESEPLTLDLLQSARQKLTKPAHHDWLFVATWFGLRPVEADSLTKPMTSFQNVKRNGVGTWAIQHDGDHDVLWIYQSKLTGLSRQKRWKGIPVVEAEQKQALEIIKSIAAKTAKDTTYRWRRPLTKTIKSATAPGVTAYGPRKAFYDMMRDRGWSDIDVSAWLGHKNLKRSNTNYADPFKARARKQVPEAA